MSGVLPLVLSLVDSLSKMNCIFNGDKLSSRLRRMSGADSFIVCIFILPLRIKGIMSKLADMRGMLAMVSPIRSFMRIESIVSLLGKFMFMDETSNGI